MAETLAEVPHRCNSARMAAAASPAAGESGKMDVPKSKCCIATSSPMALRSAASVRSASGAPEMTPAASYSDQTATQEARDGQTPQSSSQNCALASNHTRLDGASGETLALLAPVPAPPVQPITVGRESLLMGFLAQSLTYLLFKRILFVCRFLGVECSDCTAERHGISPVARV